MTISAQDAVPLIEALRGATREAHGRVDALFGSSDFAVRADYERFLVAQAAAWETVRPILSATSLMRADALRADLEALSLAQPSPVAVDRLPDAASLGARYVLEGSRLGSTVLLRLLHTRSPALTERASSYLRTSADVGPWKKLMADLKTNLDGADVDAIIDDALFVFRLFERGHAATADPD